MFKKCSIIVRFVPLVIDHKTTTCKPNGICQVEMRNGPPGGKKKGLCFPVSFSGGQCYDIPEECFSGKDVTSQCGSESWLDQSPCKEGTRYV